MMDPIEAAARAICEADVLSPASDAPIVWNGKPATAWEPRAAILRQAIDAGLFCHPPKAWMAPWEATKAMRAAVADIEYQEPISHIKSFREVSTIYAAEEWRAARDAHLKEQGRE